MNRGKKWVTLKHKAKHSNIANVALKKIRKYYGKKTKDIKKEEKQKYKAYFEGEKGVFIIEKFTRDIIEPFKLPEVIELRKKFGYNLDDIMVCEETSKAEKITKHFPHENIVLNKKFNGRKPEIWFKDLHFTVEVDEADHENYDTDDERKKRHVEKKKL